MCVCVYVCVCVCLCVLIPHIVCMRMLQTGRNLMNETTQNTWPQMFCRLKWKGLNLTIFPSQCPCKWPWVKRSGCNRAGIKERKSQWMRLSERDRECVRKFFFSERIFFFFFFEEEEEEGLDKNRWCKKESRKVSSLRKGGAFRSFAVWWG